MQLCECANGAPFAHFHFSTLLITGPTPLIYNPPLPGKTYQ